MLVERIENPPPVECLIQLFGTEQQPFILDSSQSNNGLGHWSFFGANPVADVSGSLNELRAVLSKYSVKNTSDIPFIGGAVGYMAYDYGREFESLPVLASDDRRIPALHFGIYDTIAALDHSSGVLYLIAHGLKGTAAEGLEALRSLLNKKTPVPRPDKVPACGPWQWNMDRDAFIDAVGKIKDYIASGDIYQVNLSRRARCHYQGSPLQLYQALRIGNPGPYCAYLSLGALTLLSTSPEQFLSKRGRELVTRPIKGTRPRGQSPEQDKQFANDLAGSAKERAELLMIVDLERNDLGRVAEYGSVRVEDLYQIERYAGVIHQTAQVKAHLADDKDIFDCIEALFPGGSITGAPKVRAMEIIEAMEPTRRGAYCGSIGYIGFDGNAELNIAIRSLHLIDGQLDYQVGSGIVWDSVPEEEYLETQHKARAIHETIDALCRNQS